MRLPRRPPNLNDILAGFSADQWLGLTDLAQSPSPDGKYLHWDEVRHRPTPKGCTPEQWWAGLKFQRLALYKPTPLTDQKDIPFVFGLPDRAHELLHQITQCASGSVGTSDLVTNPDTQHRYLVRGLMEEGITSSMIEGASTTRAIAKKMLSTQRAPRDRSEQMVLNNYMAMEYIHSLGKEELTPEHLFELHHIVTRETLDTPDGAGRFRRPDELVDVIDPADNEILHRPPDAKQLPERMQAMCDFANGHTPDTFIHPVIRSIILHFWLAYDHPFVDGNGRCARALFYWSMLHHDYWLCRYISISKKILQAPTRYARTFLYTETDDNDLTYFILPQLEILKSTLDELHQYLDKKAKQRQHFESRLKLKTILNSRQMDLISHALRHPDAQYDIKQYQTTHGTVYQTARTDLLKLVDLELLDKHKSGLSWVFTPSATLEAKLTQTTDG